ncbi:MAG: hypothetical protein ACPGQL_08955 [Thermoplasmatota archaeon]
MNQRTTIVSSLLALLLMGTLMPTTAATDVGSYADRAGLTEALQGAGFEVQTGLVGGFSPAVDGEFFELVDFLGLGCQPGPQSYLFTAPVAYDTGGVYWKPSPWGGPDGLYTSVSYQNYNFYTYNIEVVSGKCVPGVMAFPANTYEQEYPLLFGTPGCPNCYEL